MQWNKPPQFIKSLVINVCVVTVTILGSDVKDPSGKSFLACSDDGPGTGKSQEHSSKLLKS